MADGQKVEPAKYDSLNYLKNQITKENNTQRINSACAFVQFVVQFVPNFASPATLKKSQTETREAKLTFAATIAGDPTKKLLFCLDFSFDLFISARPRDFDGCAAMSFSSCSQIKLFKNP